MLTDPSTLASRRKRALELFAHLDVAGMFFFDLKNIRYLVGFTGSEGALFLTSEGAQLLVDGRYQSQAQAEVAGAEVVLCRDKVEGIKQLLEEGQYARVAFEATALPYELYLKITALNERVDFVPLRATDIVSLRAVKDAKEIELINHAATIAREAFIVTLPHVKPGIREKEIALELDFQMRIRGAEDLAFKTIVASGPNSALPHARPTDRVLAPGDVVVIDWGAVYQGYCSDQTCTLVLGKATEEFLAAYRLVREAHDLAIASIRAGISTTEVDRRARDRIEQGGMGEAFAHATGHGVGMEVHEYPRLAANSTGILEAQMVVTVEPGVYLPDRWGIRIEDLVLVQQQEGLVLSGVDKELMEMA